MNLTLFHWRALKTRLTLFTQAIVLLSLGSLAFYASQIGGADRPPRLLLATLLLTLLAGGLNWWMLRRQLSPLLATLAQGKASLQVSEARYRTMVEWSPEPLLVHRGGEILYVNAAAIQLFGASQAADLIGRFTHTLIHPDFLAVQVARMKSLTNNTPIVPMVESRFLTLDGSVIDVEVQGTAIVYDGEPAIHVCIRDITERKQMKESLEETREKFRALSEAAFEALFISEKGRCLEQNYQAEQLFGYSAEEALGRMGTDWIAPQDRDRVLANILAGVEFPYEAAALRKDGTTFPALIRGRMMHYKGRSVRVTSMSDITERKTAEEKIRLLAFYDQLTDLPNRTLLLERLKQAMTASERNDHQGALLFIDLDNFKTLNDTRGHDIGDLLLRQVAQRLDSCVRAGDTVARLGGDEFVVMLANLSSAAADAATQAEAIGEKILAALNQPYQLNAMVCHSTPSIGITLFQGQRASTDDLLKQADLAMYKAKEAGRNALRFFDPVMETAVMVRAALEADLREAVQCQQFLLHYQAQVVDEGRVTGAEALVRWRHPQRGLVSPAEFIPLAEDMGLILALGHWVLEAACTQLTRWAARPELAHLTLAVNVSAQEFREPDFVDQVLATLRRTGANPHRLKLELTESLLVADVEDIIAKMFALKARGVGFSLDDFGTGYSSLAYLKRLPLDQLKIDQSFVRDVLLDANDAAIARTIVALAQSLGLSVIAEGVETQAQRDFLARSGCHAYQGYFFSRPLAVEGFEQFALQRATPQQRSAGPERSKLYIQ